MTDPRRPTRRLNSRYLLGSLAVLALLILGLWFLRASQTNRFRDDALAKIRTLIDDGQGALALQHLHQYLSLAPDDIEALEIQADLLYGAANSPALVLQATEANSRLLRLDPKGKGRDQTRRRQARLYILYSDFYRASALFQNAPELANRELRYRAAETIARQIVAQSPRDSEAHLLLGMALQGQASPDDPRALAQVRDQYERALKFEPGNLEAAERLTRLLTNQGDPKAAETVLDALAKARPKAPEVHLVRYRHFLTSRQFDRAAAEIQAATELAPQDLTVRLTAAQEALRLGDPASAREHLAAIDPKHRNDLRVRMLSGLIDFSEDRPREAIDEWRRGLISSQGTSADLSWWLAYSLLRMNRVEEARPLLDQYLRLVGDESDPRLLLLRALLEEAEGRPTQAIAILEPLESKLGGSFQEKLYLTLGRCRLALGDREAALRDFRAAARGAQEGSVQAWLTLAQTLAASDPGAASRAIEQGLEQSPGEPDLLIALAESRFREQMDLPAGQRRWAVFDEALARAAKAAPRSAAVALLRADRLALDNQLEKAVEGLKAALDHNPRDARLWIAQAEGLNRLGRADEALALIERADQPEAAGDSASVRLAHARLLLAAGRGSEARETLGHDLDSLPIDQRPLVLETLGRFAASQGDAKAAREAYAAWARLRPRESRPLIASIDLALGLGDTSRLTDLLEALHRLVGEDDPTYLAARAEVLLRSPGDHVEEAMALVDRLLKQAPDLPAAHLLQGRLLERRGQTDEALSAYRRAWDGGSTMAYAPMAALLARLGRFEDLRALQSSDRAFQLGGLAALASWQAGDRDQAAQFLALAVQSRPDGLDIGPWQARLLETIGRDDEAEAALRQRAESQGDRVEPWVRLIRFQVDHGRLDAARQTAATARGRVATERPELLDAQLQLALRDFQAADQALEAALKRGPDDPEVHLAAFQYYRETARPDRAIKHLERAAELRPEDREISRELAVELSSRADQDPAAWKRAWTLIGPEASEAETPPDRLARALVLAREPGSDHVEEAIQAIQALLDDLPPQHPTAVAARDHLTRTLLNRSQYEAALPIAAVSARSGTDPTAILLYASALIQSQRFRLAEEQLDRFALVLPGDAREGQLRALLIRKRAGPKDAPEALVRAVAEAGRSPRAELLGRAAFDQLLAMGPEALDAAEKIARTLAAANPSLGWMPARIALARGQTEAAIRLIGPSISSAQGADLEQAARIAAQAADTPGAAPEIIQQAGAALLAALDRDPNSPLLMLLASLYHHQRGQYEQEVQLYRRLLEGRPEGDPEGDKLLNNLAWALSEGLERPEEGLRVIDAVLKRQPGMPQYLATRGVIRIRLKQYDQAIDDLKAAVAAQSNPIRRFHLARAYRAAGQDVPFQEQLQKAREDGLTLDMADPTEREEMAALLQP